MQQQPAGRGVASSNRADQCSVELQRVELKLVEDADRCALDADIVHRDAHAEVAQRADRLAQRCRVAQLGRRDLDGQLAGAHAVDVQQIVDIGDEARRAELHHAQVDVQAQLVVAELLVPRRQLLHGRRHHVPAEPHDLPALLGDGDEVGGRDQPTLGVLPAHQRLEPGDRAIVDAHDRLVGDEELAVDACEIEGSARRCGVEQSAEIGHGHGGSCSSDVSPDANPIGPCDEIESLSWQSLTST